MKIDILSKRKIELLFEKKFKKEYIFLTKELNNLRTRVLRLEEELKVKERWNT